MEAHLRRDERSKCTPKIVSSQGLIVNLAERTVFYGEKPLNLSNREFDIVEFLMRNANQIFDRERIYEAVWGLDAEGDSGVIKEHIRKISTQITNCGNPPNSADSSPTNKNSGCTLIFTALSYEFQTGISPESV